MPNQSISAVKVAISKPCDTLSETQRALKSVLKDLNGVCHHGRQRCLVGSALDRLGASSFGNCNTGISGGEVVKKRYTCRETAGLNAVELADWSFFLVLY